jgi:hypothetical protein
MPKFLRVSAFLLAIYSVSAAPVLAGGIIQGTVSLVTEDGAVIYADWLRVILARDKVAVPPLPDLTAMNKFEKMTAIRTAHVDFYVAARGRLAEPGFVVDSKTTTPEGSFFFDNIPAGTYYVLVTLPAMIKTYKVAWQVPVNITADETVSIQLNNQNMLLPTYCRD